MHLTKPVGPIVLSTRIRLARNLVDHPFPGWAKEAQRKEILTFLQETFAKIPEMKGWQSFPIHQLTELEKQIFVERHLISRELSTAAPGSALVMSPDQNCSIMINEEDHLRIQVIRKDLDLESIWNFINHIDDALEKYIDYAFSADFGYLTACPTNVGTGMRASVMMHLPGLMMSNHMEKVIRAVKQLGIAVRGIFGEGSDASGNIFQVSNQQTLGKSEMNIIVHLNAVLEHVMEQEVNARSKILETNASMLLDKIGRAYGILRHAHLLNSAEALNHLSLMRLAVDLKILPEESRKMIDQFLIEMQPGHIQVLARKPLTGEKRDYVRAALLREQFEKINPQFNPE